MQRIRPFPTPNVGFQNPEEVAASPGRASYVHGCPHNSSHLTRPHCWVIDFNSNDSLPGYTSELPQRKLRIRIVDLGCGPGGMIIAAWQYFGQLADRMGLALELHWEGNTYYYVT